MKLSKGCRLTLVLLRKFNFRRKVSNVGMDKYINTNKKNEKCLLKSLDPNVKDVELSGKKTPLGRSELTGIMDINCSRNQVTLKADMDRRAVLFKVCGRNPSGLNGFSCQPETGCVCYDGDIIELLYGKYQYQVCFPSQDSSEIKENAHTTESTTDETNIHWENIDNGDLYILNYNNPKASKKIAGYDLDNTIICTKSGNVFPKDIDDWKILCPEVLDKLKKVYNNGFKIVIFTNQANISMGKTKISVFQGKLELIARKLNVPLQAFVSTGKGIYRKPRIGMWTTLREKNDGIVIEMSESFYVGDAAGRPAQPKPFPVKADHSCADRLFALNLNLQFFTPEEHFKNLKCLEWKKPDFDPRMKITGSLFEPADSKVPAEKIEIIIMVGLPGCGKSNFANSILEPKGYRIINRDNIGNTQKCFTLCEQAIKNGKSCCIDNTNVTIEARKSFIEIAQRNGVDCRCFVMNVGFEQVKHNLIFRELTDIKHSKISSMTLFSMRKKLQEPKLEEGFSAIVKVNLLPKFNADEDERLYKMFLVEK